MMFALVTFYAQFGSGFATVTIKRFGKSSIVLFIHNPPLPKSLVRADYVNIRYIVSLFLSPFILCVFNTLIHELLKMNTL